MPLKLRVETLDNVPAAYRSLYAKKDGGFHLDVVDLNSHIAEQLRPVKADLEIAKASERKLVHNEFATALRNAGIRPNYEDLIIANVGGQISFDVVDGQRVIKVKGVDGYALPGTGLNGTATLTDLAKDAAKQFPSVFPSAEAAEDGGAPSNPTKRTRNTLLRSEFDALPPSERAAKMADGYTLADDTPAKSIRPLTGRQMTRASFDELQPVERAMRMKEGFTIVD